MPRGRLQFGAEPGAPLLPVALTDRFAAAFARGAGYGLLHLGAVEVGSALPLLWAFWRDFAARYVPALTATPEDGAIGVAEPDVPTLETLFSTRIR
jgi:non-specific serine/threonine protein kinase